MTVTNATARMHQAVILFAQSRFSSATGKLLQDVYFNECGWKLVEWPSDPYLQLTTLCLKTQKCHFKRSRKRGQREKIVTAKFQVGDDPRCPPHSPSPI
jgi:hypothetical protein